VDFRNLNQLTIGDAYPIPRIIKYWTEPDIRYFKILDLASGYHQVPIRSQNLEKIAFSTEQGHYEFTKMLLGICNTPRTFQRIMNNILMGVSNKKAFVYLDDKIIYQQFSRIFRSGQLQQSTTKIKKKLEPCLKHL